jgi:hypothetical protein
MDCVYLTHMTLPKPVYIEEHVQTSSGNQAIALDIVLVSSRIIIIFGPPLTPNRYRQQWRTSLQLQLHYRRLVLLLRRLRLQGQLRVRDLHLCAITGRRIHRDHHRRIVYADTYLLRFFDRSNV